MKRLVFLLCISIFLVGCAKEVIKTEYVFLEPYESKEQRVYRSSSIVWDNFGRAGAAQRMPSHIHVLGKTRLDDKVIPKNGYKINLDTDDFLENLKNIGEVAEEKKVGYSVYELQRWERYSNGGKGMDEADWNFVRSNSAELSTSTKQLNCTPPDYSYQEYLAAWVKFCDYIELTAKEKLIVKNNFRPASIVSSCPRLGK